MKLKLSRDVACVAGVFRAGDETSMLPEDVAAGLLEAGYAEVIEEMSGPASDTTDLTPEPMAERTPRRGRGRSRKS